MLTRFEVALKATVRDTVGEKTAAAIRNALDLPVDAVRVVSLFTVDGPDWFDEEGAERTLQAGALHDPVLHTISTTPTVTGFDWLVEVAFRPGVTDNEGRTAQETLATLLQLPAGAVRVYSARQYLLHAPALDRQQATAIGTELLANELIQRVTVRSGDEGADIEPYGAAIEAAAVTEVARVDLAAMSDDELMAFSRENTLALSLTEMHAIRDHYASDEVRTAREGAGIGPLPTDAEVEALAQTWSEHCKHKIFSARIDYIDAENGQSEVVDSIFKTHIARPTKDIRAAKARTPYGDYCLSVFKDNAGVIEFDEDISVCVKMETHNSPSALDPYGGALTGIVGVNRDAIGTGIGGNLLCNTDVFCFASPFYDGELPPRLLPPRRVLEGVREGVEHGGNKSGVPTVNGSIVFDERYLGKPLVYCGTVGTIPRTVNGKPGHEKEARPGDRIVMAGGRIGKDGIHGATFSSEELHGESPATAVQIGDPITQRRCYDFLMRARDAGLYTAITDNGAGGLSSSVGEMAEDTGGCRMDLSRAPLKYDGLRPWEILLSEAQERMTMAVPPENLDAFLAMAQEMGVEATDLGEFTDTGIFDVHYDGTPVAYLPMAFLHDGVPQMQLKAVWEKPTFDEGDKGACPRPDDMGAFVRTLLGRLNVCSKEYVVRQYDHEVQGGSVVKPMVGEHGDGPGDAGVLRPVLGSERGLVVSHGICPKFSDHDTYWMMAAAIDEAIRNAVATGGDPDHMAGVDNFCWCDPVQSEKTPDGEYKLAQLVRAGRSLADHCRAFGVPCISGKDSMKNDYTGGDRKISIPPTVLFSIIGHVPDVNRACTSDFKAEGEVILVLGCTADELAGSEAASELGYTGGQVPQVDAVSALRRYRTLHAAMRDGLVASCHDVSDGGLGAAIAEMCIGGRLGAQVELDAVPAVGALDAFTLLCSESASRLVVGVHPDHADEFARRFAGQACARVGTVTAKDAGLVVTSGGQPVLHEPVEALVHAFTATLGQ